MQQGIFEAFGAGASRVHACPYGRSVLVLRLQKSLCEASILVRCWSCGLCAELALKGAVIKQRLVEPCVAGERQHLCIRPQWAPDPQRSQPPGLDGVMGFR